MSLLNKPQSLLMILLVSLGLNCVGLGVLLSSFVKEKVAPRSAWEKVQQFAEKAPPEMRRAMRGQIMAHRDELRQAHDTLRGNREEIMKLINQPQFDEAVLRAKLNESREAMGRIMEVMQDSVVVSLRDLPPEQRQKMAAPLLKNFGSRQPWGQRDDSEWRGRDPMPR